MAAIIWHFTCIVSNWLNPCHNRFRLVQLKRLSFTFQRTWMVPDFFCTYGKSWPSFSLFLLRPGVFLLRLSVFLTLVMFLIFYFLYLLEAALWLLYESLSHPTSRCFEGKCLPRFRLLSLHQKEYLAPTSASLAKVYACPENFSATGQSLTVYFIYFSAHNGKSHGMKPSLVSRHSRGGNKTGLWV